MHAVRRLSMPFVQPLARLFNHEELEGQRAVTPSHSVATTTTPPPAIEETTEATQAVTSSSPSPSPPPPRPAHLPPLAQVVSNPVNSFSQHDADIPPLMQDALYQYQLTQAHPLKLSPVAFHTADIVWRFKDSEKVYNLLQKRGMITPQGEIRTAAISNKFAHQFAFLSAFAQRRVIGLLFWWEEEEQRLKKLYEQVEDITQAMRDLNGTEDRAMMSLLKIELERTRMLIKQKPSDRYDDTASARRREQLPAYAPPPPGSSRERLPMYTEDPRTYIPG